MWRIINIVYLKTYDTLTMGDPTAGMGVQSFLL